MVTVHTSSFDNLLKKIAPIEQIISDSKNGKMYILVDDENRENEGDLIIPTEFATADAINFMITFGRGLVCIAITQVRADILKLKLQAPINHAQFSTAFTASIEAKSGVTTGISTADRARTISVAIAEDCNSDDIVTPGHIFPLIAKEGGVLERNGHTEAAVDISRLAGLRPAGVICEIISQDGTMASLPELLEFAADFDLNVGTIADLIKYRKDNNL